ncbi:MAG: UDP-N-acetylglucosamine--N-acetylmuramyl-(pentapeptide) pyrophosphoryl-undecaprenol N-acetylglucosamine transferase [Pseudomonadales bacterium]
MTHVVLTGGGTAGHVVPALPIAETLKDQGHQLTWIGTRSGLEERLVSGVVDDYHGISAGKLRRYLSWKNVQDAFAVLLGVFQALILLRRLRPEVVFSKGGFVSFPVVFAAWVWRIPVVAHESDRSPGLANRLAYPFIRQLCTNFPESQTGFKGPEQYTGTPIRAALLAGDAQRGRQFLFNGASESTKPVLLITGGSLGADRLNAVVIEALPQLCAEYRVVHLCGPGKMPPLQPLPSDYRPFEYLHEQWGDVLAAADLVVSRAGANTLFELLALAKPNLLVPLTLAASRGDQIENAQYAKAAGYSQVLPEEALSPESLLAALADLTAALPDIKQRLAGFERPDATAKICAMLLECAAV